MADDKTKMDRRDRNELAAHEDYEMRYFANENGISIERALKD